MLNQIDGFQEDFDFLETSFDWREQENRSIFDSSFLSPKSNLTEEKVENFLVQKNKKIQKKEEFDYKKYVAQEMKKLDGDQLDPTVKKKLAQKIRNRMSAQRSRLRQKNKIQFLEEENKFLRDRLIEQEKQIYFLKQRNSYLEDQFCKNNESSKKSTSDDQTKQISQDDQILERVENESSNFSSLSKSILLIVCIVFLTFISPNQLQSGNVRISGMLPMITNNDDKAIMKIPSKDLQIYPSEINFKEVIPMVCFRNDLVKAQELYFFVEKGENFKTDLNKNYYVPLVQAIKQIK